MKENQPTPFIACLAQSARIAIQHYWVALKQVENIEKQAEETGYTLNRKTGELIKNRHHQKDN